VRHSRRDDVEASSTGPADFLSGEGEPGATCGLDPRQRRRRRLQPQEREAVAAGLTFRPLAQTAIDTLGWLKTLPAERQAQLRAGIKPDREKQVLEAWKAKPGVKPGVRS
jgi:hypothetical protein